MLDFLLVLGQIPGTSFQITFNELVFMVLVAIWIGLGRPAPHNLRRGFWKLYYSYNDLLFRRERLPF